MPSLPANTFMGDGMHAFSVRMPPRDVVFLKGILEAHDGLAQVYSEGGGELLVACPIDRKEELGSLLAALGEEIPSMIVTGSTL